MRVLLLEPYFTGSHRCWAEGYARHSQHQVQILSLPGRWWKWRMHGGAITLARLAGKWVAQNGAPDVILATDMLDLTSWVALTRSWSAGIPVALYMHENQLTYPLPREPRAGPMRRQRGERDLHYAFINYASMLAADAVFFNSQYHRRSWFGALPAMLRHFPDWNELESISLLDSKSGVLPLGLDLESLNRRVEGSVTVLDRPRDRLILWNHRWEYDKDPTSFFRALIGLADEGLGFQVAVCGENFRQVPVEFDQAREKLGDRIVQWGRVEPRAAYARLLWIADIVVSTAVHDFFGAAVIEAIYCGCRPVLPNGLAYPEHVPQALWARCLYDDEEQLLALLRRAIACPDLDLQEAVARYDWRQMAHQYDDVMEGVGI